MNLVALSTFAYKRFHPRCIAEICPKTNITANEIMQKKLNLSKEQLEHMTQIRGKYNKKISEIGQQLATKRAQLIREIVDDDLDQLDRICMQMDSLQAARQRVVVQYLLAQKDILTPQQRQIFSKLLMDCCGANKDTTNSCVINHH